MQNLKIIRNIINKITNILYIPLSGLIALIIGEQSLLKNKSTPIIGIIRWDFLIIKKFIRDFFYILVLNIALCIFINSLEANIKGIYSIFSILIFLKVILILL